MAPSVLTVRRLVRHPIRESMSRTRRQYQNPAIAHAARWRGVSCVFTLSTGRSGTATLATLLDHSPFVEARHEPRPRLLRLSREAFQRTATASDGDEGWDLVVEAARSDLVWHAYQRGQVYVETSNRLTYLAPMLGRYFSDSKFISLHRDPLEVIRSGLRRGWYQGHPWDWARIEPRDDDPILHHWAAFSAEEKIAWYWMAVNRDTLRFLGTLPRERWIELPSSRLFAADPVTLNALSRFLNIAPIPSRVARGVLRTPRNASRPGEDRPIDAATMRSIERIVGPIAKQLGYEIRSQGGQD
jgi:Sulfotransferase family